MISADAEEILNSLQEPTLVVSLAGDVLQANGAAAQRLSAEIVGQNLLAISTDPSALRQLLMRASGTKSPLPGMALFEAGSETICFKVHANVIQLASPSGSAALLLRLSPPIDRQFKALTDTLADLNAEVRRRRLALAVLEEAVRDRDLLVRELHHRVKNNMQMLAGMLGAAEREATHEEARAILADCSRRLVAVATVQQMLYRAESLTGVRAGEFLDLLTRSILQASGQHARVTTGGDDVLLSNDLTVPVSLIVNEALTNALKYGRPTDGEAQIHVELRNVDGEYRLSVADNGPGFELTEARRRASGLGLVRGLLRQLGGKLSVDNREGAVVVVTFRDRSAQN